MTILPLNDVKTRFSAIADEVAATHDRVIVTRNGRPHVMVISVDDFESLQMTRELLAEPGAVQGILTADPGDLGRRLSHAGRVAGRT